jgi:hypothetical protein
VEISQALTQLAEIQDKLSRAQVYRGYRALTVALTGGCALLGGWLSQSFPAAQVWPLIAVLCVSVVALEMAYDYWVNFSRHQQRMARRVLHQFMPVLGLAAAWTCVWLYSGHSPTFLPSLWALCYGFCLLSSRPYLPAGVGWVGVFYGICGLALSTQLGLTWHNLGMTLTFFLGQSLLAAVLHWNQPRQEEPA